MYYSKMCQHKIIRVRLSPIIRKGAREKGSKREREQERRGAREKGEDRGKEGGKTKGRREKVNIIPPIISTHAVGT